MNVTQLRAILDELLQSCDGAVAALCRRLFEFLIATPPDQLKMLTFKTLSDVSGQARVDRELLTALSVLETTRVSLLETHLLLIDDDEKHFDITKSDLAAAREHGGLVHPETGELIANFEDKVFPYFVPTELLLNAKSEQK